MSLKAFYDLNATIFLFAIRIAFLAYAGNDEIGLGDKPKTGKLVASVPIISGNGIDYFLHLELPPYFCICLFFGRAKNARVARKKRYICVRERGVNGEKENRCV